MRARHARQRALSISHPSSGRLSYGLIAVPQFGQRETDTIHDSPRGSRIATTFKNDPAISPPTAASASVMFHSVRAHTLVIGRIGRRISRGNGRGGPWRPAPIQTAG